MLKGTGLSHWFRYVDDTWVKILKDEQDAFYQHINNVDNNIKFTCEPIQDHKLPFLDSVANVKEDGTLGITVYRKPTHTDQYLLFSSHHPLEHKLGVVRTLFHRADTVVADLEDRRSEHGHLKGALRKCGYRDWVFHKAKRDRTSKAPERTSNLVVPNRKVNIVLPYVQGTAEKVKRLLMKRGVSVSFKPPNTLRNKLVHPKDRISKDRKSSLVYRVQCSYPGCEDSYIGETQQTLKARMKQHARPNNSTGVHSGVYQHMMERGHHFDPVNNVSIIDRETRWFERGVREAIYERKEQPAMNKTGGLRFTLAHSWDRAIKAIPLHICFNC